MLKPPTYQRYVRIELILSSDEALRRRLGPKTETVCKPPPSNDKIKFAKPVIMVADRLHQDGIDSHSANKADVIRLAFSMMQDGTGGFELGPSKKEAAPAAPTAAPTAPATAKREVKKPAIPVAAEVQPEVQTKPEPAPESTPAQKALQPGVPIVMAISMVTLLMAVDQILESQANFPNKAENQKLLAELIRNCQQATEFPKSVA